MLLLLQAALMLSAALCNPQPSTSLFVASGFWQTCAPSHQGGCRFRPVVAACVTAVSTGLSGFEFLVSVWRLNEGIFIFFSPVCVSSVYWAMDNRGSLISTSAFAVCMSSFRVCLLQLLKWMDDAIPLSALALPGYWECVSFRGRERERHREGCRWMKLILDVCTAGWVVARQWQPVCFIFSKNIPDFSFSHMHKHSLCFGFFSPIAKDTRYLWAAAVAGAWRSGIYGNMRQKL